MCARDWGFSGGGDVLGTDRNLGYAWRGGRGGGGGCGGVGGGERHLDAHRRGGGGRGMRRGCYFKPRRGGDRPRGRLRIAADVGGCFGEGGGGGNGCDL